MLKCANNSLRLCQRLAIPRYPVGLMFACLGRGVWCVCVVCLCVVCCVFVLCGGCGCGCGAVCCGAVCCGVWSVLWCVWCVCVWCGALCVVCTHVCVYMCVVSRCVLWLCRAVLLCALHSPTHDINTARHTHTQHTPQHRPHRPHTAHTHTTHNTTHTYTTRTYTTHTHTHTQHTHTQTRAFAASFACSHSTPACLFLSTFAPCVSPGCLLASLHLW